jgi:hypothetical protein
MYESEKLLEAGMIDAAIVELVRERDYVSMVEIERFLKDKMPVKGDVAIVAPNFENIFLWGGVSEEFVDVVMRLMNEKQIYAHPADWMSYLIDGGMLQLPIAKRAHQYKKPHWLPVCFRVTPP